MPRSRKHTNEELRDIIDSEGLGYAIQFHTSADSIEDEEVAALWKTAKEAMDEIEALLPESSEEGY
jgi:hypothetical protein